MTDPHLVGRDKDTPQEQRPSPAVLLTVCVSASPIFVFNRELGDGACVRNGGMTFDHFIDQLGKLGFVGPWHFAPNVVNALASAPSYVAACEGARTSVSERGTLPRS